MKVNIFLPKYMVNFKCINSKCSDTCCAGWDINIDENTYNKYLNSNGQLKELLKDNFFENNGEHDFFNRGFIVLKDKNKCSFLNCDMLCDIHGKTGEKNLCITCKSYPRVYNIVDNVYEKSGLPSCPEICVEAFLNKEKMEFVEIEEEIEEVEIRRIVDCEAFEGTESILQYFWDIRVASINILQTRKFSIEERLKIIKELYKQIEEIVNGNISNNIEEVLEEYNNDDFEYDFSKFERIKETNEFYLCLADDELEENIRSLRLKKCVKEYRNAIYRQKNISDYIEKSSKYCEDLEKYSYIFENYLVNQIFKDLVPFNKGENIIDSITVLINSYRIIKAYVIGVAMNSKEDITDEKIIRVIQALSKDIEHNKVFKELLERI